MLLTLQHGALISTDRFLSYPVESGTIFLLAPCRQRFFTTEHGWDVFWFGFNTEYSVKWQEVQPGLFKFPDHAADVERASGILEEAFQLAMECRDGWRPLAAALVDVVILRGNMHHGHENLDANLLRAAELLRERRGTSMNEIARVIGMSRASFFAKFKAVYKITPHEYREQYLLRLGSAIFGKLEYFAGGNRVPL